MFTTEERIKFLIESLNPDLCDDREVVTAILSHASGEDITERLQSFDHSRIIGAAEILSFPRKYLSGNMGELTDREANSVIRHLAQISSDWKGIADDYAAEAMSYFFDGTSVTGDVFQ